MANNVILLKLYCNAFLHDIYLFAFANLKSILESRFFFVNVTNSIYGC